MYKKIYLAIVVVTTLCLMSSCISISVGDQGTGEITDVKKHLSSKIKGDVTDIELIDTVHYDEYKHTDSFGMDGAVFWQGKEKTIPAHNVLYYRGFSKTLDSFVFIRWNDDRNNKTYSIIQNYEIDKEKKSARNILESLQKLYSKDKIEIANIKYSKFEDECNDLDSTYILDKDFYNRFSTEYYDPFGQSQNPLHIEVSAELDIDYLYLIQNSITEIMDKNEYGISLHITTNDGSSVVFYRGGRPLLTGNDGFSTYFE